MTSNRSTSSVRNLDLARYAFGFFSFVVFAAILWQGFFAFPNADDFCFASQGRDYGAFVAASNTYVNWTGRFTSSFLIALFGAQETLFVDSYFILPTSVLLLVIWSCYHTFAIFGIKSKVAMFVFAILLLSGFSWRETVLWLSGASTYALGCVAAIFLWGQYWSIAFTSRPKGWLQIVIVALATLLAAGFNEPLMVAQIVVIASMLVITYRAQGKLSKPLLLFLVIAFIGALVVALAPGNAQRSTHFVQPTLLSAVFGSLIWLFSEHAISMVATFVALYCCALVFDIRLTAIVDRSVARHLAFGFLLAAWASVFARFYAVGASGPARAWTVDATLLFFAIFFLVQSTLIRKADAPADLEFLTPSVTLFLMCAFFLALVMRPTPDNAMLRTSIGAAKYAKKLSAHMKTRFETLRRASPDDALVFDDYPDKNKALTSFLDFDINPNEGQNVCAAGYFKVKSVALRAAKAAPAQ
jgi:Family of unknown function (DUF6056)